MDPNPSGLNSYFQHQANPPPLSAALPVSGATGINASPTNGAVPTIVTHASIPNPTAIASTTSSPMANSITVPSAVSTGMEGVKKKRGRPRKYATPEEAAAARRLASALNSTAPLKKKQRVFRSGLGGGMVAASFSSSKSFQSNAQSDLYKPHVLIVAAGEDLHQKIMSFIQQNKGEVCIISALGALSSVCLRQPPATSGVTYEGRYDIVFLSGSFVRTEHGERAGELSISFTSNDGHIIGGEVDGPLIAAGSIQVIAIAGTFVMDNKDYTAGVTSDAGKPPSPSGGVETFFPGVSFQSPNDLYQSYGGGGGGDGNGGGGGGGDQYMNMQ